MIISFLKLGKWWGLSESCFQWAAARFCRQTSSQGGSVAHFLWASSRQVLRRRSNKGLSTSFFWSIFAGNFSFFQHSWSFVLHLSRKSVCLQVALGWIWTGILKLARIGWQGHVHQWGSWEMSPLSGVVSHHQFQDWKRKAVSPLVVRVLGEERKEIRNPRSVGDNAWLSPEITLPLELSPQRMTLCRT